MNTIKDLNIDLSSVYSSKVNNLDFGDFKIKEFMVKQSVKKMNFLFIVQILVNNKDLYNLVVNTFELDEYKPDLIAKVFNTGRGQLINRIKNFLSTDDFKNVKKAVFTEEAGVKTLDDDDSFLNIFNSAVDVKKQEEIIKQEKEDEEIMKEFEKELLNDLEKEENKVVDDAVLEVKTKKAGRPSKK